LAGITDASDGRGLHQLVYINLYTNEKNPLLPILVTRGFFHVFYSVNYKLNLMGITYNGLSKYEDIRVSFVFNFLHKMLIKVILYTLFKLWAEPPEGMEMFYWIL